METEFWIVMTTTPRKHAYKRLRKIQATFEYGGDRDLSRSTSTRFSSRDRCYVRRANVGSKKVIVLLLNSSNIMKVDICTYGSNFCGYLHLREIVHLFHNFKDLILPTNDLRKLLLWKFHHHNLKNVSCKRVHVEICKIT